MAAFLSESIVRDLPVVEAMAELRVAMAEAGSAVLVAPPGAGKTTVVPLALAGEDWLGGGRVVVLEPRRLAARAAAERMSFLLGEPGAGGTVGYRVRGETRVGPSTRVEVVTEGVLTRMLQSDPSLSDVGLVVFDEFHERSIHADLGLALSLHARALLRPDLRILVMSATLDTVPVAGLLGGAPVVSSEGRAFPVDTHWLNRPVTGPVEGAAVRAVVRALEEDAGDVLVFLPGAGEIRRTERGLAQSGLPAGVVVRPLFGNLTRHQQDLAIAPSSQGERKVVLATSIAETSLTIEGVRVVIDSGLMRVPRFDPGTGLSRLETVRVTRDSADQRRGRAGRTAPGVCHRLWTAAEDRGLVPERRPEIVEADLAPLALELAAWGAEPSELRWLDPPPTAAFSQAMELLGDLEAVSADGSATPHGRRLARLGLHPRLGHMLGRARALGLGPLACDLAALLSERDILRAEGRAPDADLRLRVEILADQGPGAIHAPGTVAGQQVDRGALRQVARESQRLRRAIRVDRGVSHPARGGARGPGQPAAGHETGLLLALAYPDRIGQRRPDQRGRFLLRNGRGARFAEPQPLEGADWIVAAELEGQGSEARIFRAAPLTLADIEAHFAAQIEEEREVFWDSAAGRVVARRRTSLGALTLAEAALTDPDPAAVGHALLAGVRDMGLEALPWTEDTKQLRQRLHFLHRLDPEAWPDRAETTLLESLEDWLLPYLAGMRRWTDLRRLDLTAALLGQLPWDRRARLDALAPTHVQVPSGSRIRIDYSDPAAPALAVRLQEVFGLVTTPTVGGGSVPLTVHLLSPARRPVQVTRDLASFWRQAYFEVRKDLRGRYPKHYWPEDPMTAVPTRRVRPRPDAGYTEEG
jgi:ATP-dependent helicase HrpB